MTDEVDKAVKRMGKWTLRHIFTDQDMCDTIAVLLALASAREEVKAAHADIDSLRASLNGEVERGDELEAEITNLRRQVQAATDGAQSSQKEM